MSYAREIVRGRVYLVTRRCTQRQFLLRPDDDTNNAFLYCLAYAANRTNVAVVAFIANSNHYHAVVIDKEARIPEFLEAFHKLLAKHQNALRGRWENFWASEQTSLVELVDPEDVMAKMIYTLTNPVKDHLVERAEHWPGSSSRLANLNGDVLRATRPKRFFRRNGTKMPPAVELECVRAPGHEAMRPAEYRAMLESAIRVAEEAAADERRRTGRKVLGRQAVLSQRPTDSPDSRKPRRVLNPTVAAKDKGRRIEALRHRRRFRGEYDGLRDQWRRGVPVLFPHGTYWVVRFAGAQCKPPPDTSTWRLDDPVVALAA